MQGNSNSMENRRDQFSMPKAMVFSSSTEEDRSQQLQLQLGLQSIRIGLGSAGIRASHDAACLFLPDIAQSKASEVQSRHDCAAGVVQHANQRHQPTGDIMKDPLGTSGHNAGPLTAVILPRRDLELAPRVARPGSSPRSFADLHTDKPGLASLDCLVVYSLLSLALKGSHNI
jgi:hypothetical protein